MSATHRLCGRAWIVLLGCCLVITNHGKAADDTWTGLTNSDWTKAGNWSNGLPLGGDSAIFSTLAPGASSTPTIDLGNTIDVSGLVFTSAAPAYQMHVNMGVRSFPSSLTLSGTGISSSSAVLQTLNIDAGFAPLPPDPLTAFSGGRLVFTNTATINASSAGLLIVLKSPQGAGVGSITPASFTLQDYSTPGNARINVLADHNGTAGGNAFIRFRDLSSAGSAQIDIEGGYNDGAYAVFENASTAGNSWISNGAGFPNGGYTLFLHGSRAGSAQINNVGSSDITMGGGRTLFRDDARALSANITNYGGNGGNGGSTIFDDTSSATDATITAQGGILGGAGGITEFRGNSSASNATLIANGSLNGGQGGVIRFLGNATAGSATVTTNAGATFDISALNTTGITVRSIAGAGNYILGDKKLTLSSNNTNINTTVSGIISGANGSLTKFTGGTLTLSGQNTFSGGVTLSGGTLNFDSSSALGTGVFTLSGGRLSSTNNTAVIPNPASFKGQSQLAPLTELEFAGPVTLSIAVTIEAFSAGLVRFSNSITGGGSFSLKTIFQNVDSSFIMSGGLNNTNTGFTSVGDGNGRLTLILAKTGGAIAVPAGPLGSELRINNRGTVRLAQGEQISDGGTVRILAGGTLDLDGYNETVSDLSADSGSAIQLHSASSAGTLTVNSGSISGISDGGFGGNLIKTSAGSLNLRGPNTYSGTTSVAGGTLFALGSSPAGTGPVFVEPGATLGGTGSFAGPVLIKDQATLSPGSIIHSSGSISFKDLTLSSQSEILLNLVTPDIISGGTHDRITVLGKLVLDGTLQFDTINDPAGLGDYLLFSYSGSFIDNGLEIGTPPPGYSRSDLTLDYSHPGQVILHIPEPTSMLLLFTPLFLRRRHLKTHF